MNPAGGKINPTGGRAGTQEKRDGCLGAGGEQWGGRISAGRGRPQEDLELAL